MRRTLSAIVVLGILAGSHGAGAEWILDLEGGAVFSGYNDVRVPGDSGTEFSLTDDLATDGAPFWRLRVGHRWNDRHELRLLVAPLRLTADGSIARDLHFAGVDFPAGVPLDATYRFDSYRLTYRYLFVISPQIDAAIGLTAKVRDAEIRLESASQTVTEKNTGPVPLLAFAFDWALSDELHLRIEGDALVGPQGRAEDVFIGVTHPLGLRMLLRGGYRLLEGGADVESVYNFTLIHYAAFGVEIML